MRIRFYCKSSGRSPVEEFLNTCSSDIRSDFFDAVNLLVSGQHLAMPLSRSLASIYSGLHELRLKDRGGQIRIFYFIKKGDGIYMLHAFKKKTQVLPAREVELAIKRIKEI